MIKTGDLIYIKLIAPLLSQEYCLYEIYTYVTSDLAISSDRIRKSNSDYIARQPLGYLQFSSCYPYFPHKYWHQYVLSKELQVDIDLISKYIIHHVDEDKTNNDIDNLFIFYDKASHKMWHKISKYDETIDIKTFNNEYIDDLIDKENAESVKGYLRVLDKKNTYQSLLQDNKHFSKTIV